MLRFVFAFCVAGSVISVLCFVCYVLRLVCCGLYYTFCVCVVRFVFRVWCSMLCVFVFRSVLRVSCSRFVFLRLTFYVCVLGFVIPVLCLAYYVGV